MRFISKSTLVLTILFTFMTPLAFFPGLAKADFNVAITDSVEKKPAVAYNSQTGKFLVAYLIDQGSGAFELRCQLHNNDGSKSGGVLMPFVPTTDIMYLGTPAIAYSPKSNLFLVAVPVAVLSGPSAGQGIVRYRFLNGDGTFISGGVTQGLLFPPPPPPPTITPYSKYLDGDGVGSMCVVHNSILDEFVVTVLRTVPSQWLPPSDEITQICAQRISYSSGTIGSVVTLVESDPLGFFSPSSHTIAYMPMLLTSPNGGRYLFSSPTLLLNSQLDKITEVPLYFGKPEGDSAHPDISYGEVDGQHRFLLVYSDENNCRPGEEFPCEHEWTGVWGTYVDPWKTSYPDLPEPNYANNTPFPISYIWNHIKTVTAPRVSYNPTNKSFAVVWREIPVNDPANDESRSHIRGTVVDYFVEDGLYGTPSVPLPDPDSMVVISDITGTCSGSSSDPCYSNEDPTFPDVAANNPAVIVWHQKFPANPSDLDVFGDFFSDFNYPAGDELAADFGTNGLWHYDGASWSKLTTWNPDDDLAGWSGGLAVDFGGDGLWNHDGTSWSQKTSWNPGSGGLAGWSGGLAADFDADGLWVFDGTFWSKKTSWNPDNLAGWSGGLAVDFGTDGLWSYDGSSWRKLTTWNPTGMSGWSGGLAVGFSTTNDGLWSYDGSSWSKLTSWNPDNLAGWSGGLAVDFGTDGLWSYDGSSWNKLTTWNPTGMSGWGGGLAVDFGADGLWNYDGTSWSKKTSWQCENMADMDLN